MNEALKPLHSIRNTNFQPDVCSPFGARSFLLLPSIYLSYLWSRSSSQPPDRAATNMQFTVARLTMIRSGNDNVAGSCRQLKWQATTGTNSPNLAEPWGNLAEPSNNQCACLSLQMPPSPLVCPLLLPQLQAKKKRKTVNQVDDNVRQLSYSPTK